jgi:hypothetical protein
VVALTVDDVATLLSAGSDPEMRALFEPGIMADRLSNLVWDREHGEPSASQWVCERLVAAAWREQVAAATTGDPQDAPILNEDAAILLVDQVLLEEEGSQRPVTRDQIRAAFLHLSDPLVGKAIWTDAPRTAIAARRH